MRWLMILFLLFIPSQWALANVSISEVAWMGSSESANYEWIELYNSGDEVSVEAWTLGDGRNLSIPLTGTIPAGAYVVLERNRSDGASVVVPAPFLNYAGALINTGTTLTLTRADGSMVDQVAGGENWQSIGGDNTTKDTAQYTSQGWITAPPTPGRANATVASPPPVTPTSTTSQTTPSTGRSNSNSGVSAGAKASVVSATPAPLSLQITLPQYLYERQPIALKVTPSGSGQAIRNSLIYEWNFGDLDTSTSKDPIHTYQYPGTYNVVVQATFAGQSATARQTITVLPLTVSLAHTATGDVLLHNDALYEVDVSEYYLSGTKTKKIPPRTYLAPRETITVPWQMVADEPFPQTALFGRTKEIITRTEAKTIIPATATVLADVPVVSSASAQVVAPVSGLVSVLPAASSEQAISNGVMVESSTTTSIPTLFGFATAEAQSSEVHTEATPDLVGIAESMPDTDATTQADIEAGAPVILVGSAQSPGTPPTAGARSAVWTYFILLLVLGGAMASILLRPARQSKETGVFK